MDGHWVHRWWLQYMAISPKEYILTNNRLEVVAAVIGAGDEGVAILLDGFPSSPSTNRWVQAKKFFAQSPRLSASSIVPYHSKYKFYSTAFRWPHHQTRITAYEFKQNTSSKTFATASSTHLSARARNCSLTDDFRR